MLIVARAQSMAINFSVWKPLTPALIGEAPTCPGVYELATLVRTVVFIGAAGHLGEALAAHLNAPPNAHLRGGQLYFRVAPLDEPEDAQAALIEEFRALHGGAFPAAQTIQPPAPVTPRRHLKAVV
ncbi:MAG: hypothetical protein B6D46_01115 [Polyangiaceae bacterium UTPRO1]|nr:MAG: hypothetical protein B6D46_01115 [Polyangiaceae bacterium UTPRO1]